MKHYLRSLSQWLILLCIPSFTFAQKNGDYRTVANAAGTYSTISLWEKYNSTTKAWEAATVVPASNIKVTVRAGATISLAATTTIDSLIIESGGTFKSDGTTRTLRALKYIQNEGTFGSSTTTGEKVSVEVQNTNDSNTPGVTTIDGSGTYYITSLKALTGVRNLSIVINAPMNLTGEISARYRSDATVAYDMTLNNVTFTINSNITTSSGLHANAAVNSAAVLGRYKYIINGTLTTAAMSYLQASASDAASAVSLVVNGTYNANGGLTLSTPASAGMVNVLVTNGGTINLGTSGVFTPNSVRVATSGTGKLKLPVGTTGTVSFPVEIAGNATATATVQNTDKVTGIVIKTFGAGYTSAPTVTFTAAPSGGTTATGTAIVSGGQVTGITITNPGSGYINAPTIAFSGGGFTTVAAGFALMGTLSAINVTNGGSGYEYAPTVIISGGAKAKATANVSNGSITSITIDDAGFGFVSAPAVDLIGGKYSSSVDVSANTTATSFSVGAVGQSFESGAAVSKKWTINPDLFTTATIALPWLSRENGVATDPATIKLYNYSGNAWNEVNSSAASSGSGTKASPYVATIASISTFGNFALSNNAPDGGVLPLNILSFNAKLEGLSKRVNLNWTVSNEQNVASYIIERGNGNTFVRLGKVSSLKTDGSLKSYTFVDESALDGTNYYRLLEVDNDGSVTMLSKLVKVDIGLGAGFKVYPNPVTTSNLLTVSHPPAEGNAEIKVMSLNGSLLLKVKPEAGSNSTLMDVSALLPGAYVVSYSSNSVKLSSQIIKQ